MMPSFDFGMMLTSSRFATTCGIPRSEEKSETCQMEVDFSVAPIFFPIKLEGTSHMVDIYSVARGSETLNVYVLCLPLNWLP
jgi:hypothetical protein